LESCYVAETTKIEWCDSTLNLQMGCAGCELWNPAKGVRHCYAGTLTEVYGGKKGWPKTFTEPALFLERLAPALRWPDLRGTKRPGKPWLDGLPRMVFLNDMGDTFTEGLPLEWLAPLLPRLADSPHVWMILTKRAKRMRAFSAAHPLPANVWPGVSVTTQPTAVRAVELALVKGGGVRWVSAEPLLGALDFADGPLSDESTMGQWSMLDGIGLLIGGGESGPGARPCHPDWARSLRAQCGEAGAAFFWKQWGEWAPYDIVPGGDLGGDVRLGRATILSRGGEPNDGHFRRQRGDTWMHRLGKHLTGRLLDGREYSEFPRAVPA
jgi:protein gp37